MPTYNAAFSGINGSYYGLGLLALNVVGSSAIVQAASGVTTVGSGTGTFGPLTFSFAGPVTAGNCIVLIQIYQSTPGFFYPDAYVVSDSLGNSYTQVQIQGFIPNGGGQCTNWQYVAENVTGGSDTITVSWTYTGSPTKGVTAVLALEISGLATSGSVADKSQFIAIGTPTHTLSVSATGPVLLLAIAGSGFTPLGGNGATVSGYSLIGTADNTAGSDSIKAFTASIVSVLSQPVITVLI